MTKFLRKNDEKGFTLIELLVVVAIIGILVAIAIPQFAAYKKSAADSGAKATLANLAVAMEASFVGNNTYVGATEATLAANYGYTNDANVTVDLTKPTANSASTWDAIAYATAGTRTYTWDAAAGGLVP